MYSTLKKDILKFFNSILKCKSVFLLTIFGSSLTTHLNANYQSVDAKIKIGKHNTPPRRGWGSKQQRKAMLQTPCTVITQWVSDQVWTMVEENLPPSQLLLFHLHLILQSGLSRMDSWPAGKSVHSLLPPMSCCLDRLGKAKLLTHCYHVLCDSNSQPFQGFPLFLLLSLELDCCRRQIPMATIQADAFPILLLWHHRVVLIIPKGITGFSNKIVFNSL